MKMNLRNLLSLLIFSNLCFLNAQANIKSPIKLAPKVIYGNDDRLDVFESSDSLMRELAKSTAAQILNNHLILIGDSYIAKAATLSENGVCSSERFANQITPANCSGFLIAPDVLVTAGHCVTEVSDCENHSWVFDFANTKEESHSFTFSKDQVFHCTNIIAREKNNTTMNDYSVLRLDRPVLGRNVLKIRTTGKVADDAVMTVLGHPTGLPLKITAAADMRDNSDPIYFKTNADTYGGNSGSAVVDSRTGIVEGILVRGDQDYAQAENENCLVSVHRDQDGGRGEDATRITNILLPPK
jgi:V8-like Glu-specific endopeptidase